MTVDKTVLNEKLDENPKNVEAFFSGGDYTNPDGSTTALTGAFVDMSTLLSSYTDYSGILSQFTTSVSDQITSLEEQKTSATERLDAKYSTLQKQWGAYDTMISKLNSTSTLFTQLINAQNGTKQ
jgi:flagellar capping protein FliD